MEAADIKRPQFVRCPVCGVEFLVQNERQRGCTKTCAHIAKRLTEITTHYRYNARACVHEPPACKMVDLLRRAV